MRAMSTTQVSLKESTAEQESDECPNGEEWCPGPRETVDDPLPCFDCFHVLPDER